MAQTSSQNEVASKRHLFEDSEEVEVPSKIQKLEKDIELSNKVLKLEKDVEVPSKTLKLENEVEVPTKRHETEKEIDVPPKRQKIENLETQTIKYRGFKEEKKPREEIEEHHTAVKQPAEISTALLHSGKEKKTETGGKLEKRQEKKTVRKRMKSLFKSVVNLMEFYFSDANLLKDGYLKKMIDNSPDGYVDLTVFSNFNKLQSLHKDGVSQHVLVRALRTSKLLQLNPEETQVKRVAPLPDISQEEIDSRTVYVEDLPPHANHTWVKNIFSKCGSVVYISLPVYKTTKQIKEFAFVEFETAEEAAKACQLLNNPLPSKALERPGKFPKGNKELKRLQKIVPFDPSNNANENSADNKELPLNSENYSGQVVSDKDQQVPSVQECHKKKKKSKKRKIVDETTVVMSGHPHQDLNQGSKKKKKKKKKKVQCDEGTTQQKCQTVFKDPNKKDQTEMIFCDEKPQNKELIIDGANQNQTENCDPTNEVNDQCILTVDSRGLKADNDKKNLPSTGSGLNNPTSDNMDLSKGDCNKSSILPTEEGKKEDLKIKKKKKKRKSEKTEEELVTTKSNPTPKPTANPLSRKERKLLRQEDIKRKKMNKQEAGSVPIPCLESNATNEVQFCEKNNPKREERLETEKVDIIEGERKVDGSEITSILKMKKGQEKKKVEFDPVAITTEFVRGREVRKRKKPKKDDLHLRVIAKKEWLALKAEYIAQQKSHVAALKESLRELRQQETNLWSAGTGNKHLNLEDVFGTKRLKASQEVKMAHVESLKFTPNVIIQWKCSHEVHRDKIKTMFKEISGDSIAYIDAKEEAKTGYIRFKDEASAEEFARMSRQSTSFMARILPVDQQEAYWAKANEDRLKKLGSKKKEKGSERIARKVFERNKATFHQKPTRIVFNEDDEENVNLNKKNNTLENGNLNI